MITVLRVAAVPVEPRARVSRLLGRPWRGPVLLAADELGAAGHDPAPVIADVHVLEGDLVAAARHASGHRALVVQQLLRVQQDDPPDATDLRAFRGEASELAVARVFAAWADPATLDVTVLHDALDALREAEGPTAVARLALAAALALDAAGHPERAMAQALRSLAQGRSVHDEALKTQAQRVIGWLRGSTQDEHVAQLVRVTAALGSRDGRVLFDRIAAATLELVQGADRAFVLLGPADGLRVVGRALQPGESGSPSLAIAAGVVLEGREVVSSEVRDVARSESIEALDLRTALCIPLSDEHRCIGAIYADSRSATGQDLQQVAWLVRAFAAYAAVAVRNRELLDDANHRTLHARELAHDLRNVASGMRLGLGELDELVDDHDARVTIRDLNQMVRALHDALQDLLDDRTPTHEPVDLALLVREGANLLRFQARARKVKLQLRADPAWVHGSADALSRVVANLVGNALKYSEPGDAVQIRVGTKGERAFVIVADQGPGIPAEALETIFASGAQAEGARPGHGLGLAICRSIVEDHGGTLQAANRKERGARFTAVLPRLPGAAPAG